MLKNNHFLKTLSLSFSLFHIKNINDDIQIFKDILKYNTLLTSLYLDRDHIENISFLERLKYNSTLTSLDLNRNNIKDILFLTDGLKYNNKLEYLDLSYNHINNINLFSDVLKENNTLLEINFEYNNINYIKALESLQYNRTLTSLIIDKNNVYNLHPLVK